MNANLMVASNAMDKIVALCKRRGFIFPGSEIYGGLNGTWDLGPLGVYLAQNIKKEWWKSIVHSREDVVPLDSSILHASRVWKASGHVANFSDSLKECRNCHLRLREDHLIALEEFRKHLPKTTSGNIALSHKHKTNLIELQHCKESKDGKHDWTEAKQFNLMFKTYVGPIDNEENKTYLRPETAQGIFINFKNVIDSTRINIPFGIAQIGKGFRNEITTGNFLFRVREFEMMEMEFFVKPEESTKWYEYWKKERLNWYLRLGIKKENIKLVDLAKEDIAHYSKGTTEIWYNWPFTAIHVKPGFGELEGIANRGDFDLSNHSKYSGKDLSYFDEKTSEKYLPYVIEPSVGVGRAMLAFLLDSYWEEEKRVVLKLHPRLAPYKVAVFPLLANKPELVEKAEKIYKELRGNFATVYDGRGNIGKRYYAQDEIGTPFCVTVDFDSLKDNTVTVRDRDTMKQERIKISEVVNFVNKKLV